jgi:hypothetical protein
MSCLQIHSVDEAIQNIPSSVLPINGLRRDSEGNLTKDAMTMIIDGLKSRGVDPTDKEANARLRKDLATFLCSLNNQYKVLVTELIRKTTANAPVTKEFIEVVKEKNMTMQDVINVSGYLEGIKPFNSDSEFIEGWQNTQPTIRAPNVITIEGLQNELSALNSNSYLELRKHMVEMTEEKNRVASNYLGLYGFLNLVAVGLLIYMSAGSK